MRYTKAFKGKGDAMRWRRETEEHLQLVHRAMTELSAATKAVTGKPFYLDVYRRGEAYGMSIRWRMSGHHRHATWNGIGKIVKVLPVTLTNWYSAANREACLLNIQERALRHTLKAAAEALEVMGK